MKTFRALITEVNWKPNASTVFPVSDKVEYTATSKDGKVVVCVHENSDGSYGVVKKFNNAETGPATIRPNVDSAKHLANALTAAYDLHAQPQAVAESTSKRKGLKESGIPGLDEESPWTIEYVFNFPPERQKEFGIYSVQRRDAGHPDQDRVRFTFDLHDDRMEDFLKKCTASGLLAKWRPMDPSSVTVFKNPTPGPSPTFDAKEAQALFQKRFMNDGSGGLKLRAEGTRRVRSIVENYDDSRRGAATLADMVADSYRALGESHGYALDVSDIMSHIKVEFGATPSITEVLRVLSSSNYVHNEDGTYSPGLIGEGIADHKSRRYRAQQRDISDKSARLDSDVFSVVDHDKRTVYTRVLRSMKDRAGRGHSPSLSHIIHAIDRDLNSHGNDPTKFHTQIVQTANKILSDLKA